MPKVNRLDLDRPEDFQAWQDFIMARPDTQFADLGPWRRIFYDLYRIPSATFLCEGGTGGASLYLIASPFFGRILVTCPFFGSGGFYADDAETRTALLESIAESAKHFGADFIELRLRVPTPEPYQTHTAFLEFDMRLDADEETIWKERLASNVRQNIRKAEKANLAFSFTDDPHAPYNLISTNIRDLGTPYHPEKLFKLMKRHLPDHIRFSQVHHEDQLVAAGVVVTFKQRISTPYIGSLKAFRHTRANYSQYWNIVKHALDNGITCFDMGRSPKGSEHQKFKEKWGAQPVAVHYAHRTRTNKPYRTVLEPSKTEAFASNAWKQLPIGFARRLGPLIARGIP